jgi:hypothetical protein
VQHFLVRRWSGGAVRNACRAAGTGGLRRVRVPVGEAVRVGGDAGVLAVDVAALLERQDMATLFRRLEEAFAFFGGVPEELLFDQMKAVSTKDLRLLASQIVVNEEFLRFAALGLPPSRVPAVPHENVGQGGAADPLPA